MSVHTVSVTNVKHDQWDFVHRKLLFC